MRDPELMLAAYDVQRVQMPLRQRLEHTLYSATERYVIDTADQIAEGLEPWLASLTSFLIRSCPLTIK